MKPLRLLVVVSLVCGLGLAELRDAAGQEAEFNTAASLQNAGEYELASKDWEAILTKFPKHALAPKARHYLGVCQLKLKPPKFDAAEVNFQDIVKNQPNFELLQDAYFNLGWSQYSQAQAGKAAKYADAATTFGELVKKFDKGGKFTDQALYYQGESLYFQGKKKEAIDSYAALVKNHDKSPLRADALYGLGVAQQELNQFAEAGATYDQFIKDFDKHEWIAEVRLRKAETVLKQEKFADAAALFAKVATDFPKAEEVKSAPLFAARAFYKADKFDDSATWFQKVFDGGSEDAPEAAHWLCRILLRKKDPAKAADLAGKALPKADKSAFFVNLKMDQADALYETPATRPQSVDLYAKLATDHAQHALAPQALYNAAFGAQELKKFDDALKFSDSFLKAYPQHDLLADVKFVAAESNLQLGKHAEAEKGFQDLVAKHATHADAESWRVRLGLTQYFQKKYKDVIASLKPAVPMLKAMDAIAESQFLIGASSFFENQLDDAVAALNASLKANPKWRQSDEVLLFLGRTQKKQEKLPDAIKSVQQLIAEFPQSKLIDQANYRLGEYTYAAGDYKAATAAYDVVLTKSADSQFAPYAAYGKGWSQFKAKEFAPAVETFSTVITKYPQFPLLPDTLFARAMSRRQAGDFKGTIEDVNAYLKANPANVQKSNALYERGQAEVGLKDNAAAVATFESILKDDPKFALADKVLYEIGWAYKLQEKPAESVAAFQKLATGYPDSPQTAEAFFHIGQDQYGKKEYAESVKSYTASKAKAGKSEVGEQATYKLGWSHFQLQKYEDALKEFADQLTNYPQGVHSSDALFMKAECLFKVEKYMDAFPAFQAAQKATDTNPKAQPEVKMLILLHGGQSAGKLDKWQEALAFLTPFPTLFPESRYLPDVMYETGRANQQLNKLDEALKFFEQAATKSTGEVGAKARFMMGEVHFTAKRHNEAIAEFKRCMYGYDGDKAPKEVKNWQAKAASEAGRCAEVQVAAAQGDARAKLLADAKTCYDFIVNKHPESELVPKAKERLVELAKIK